MEELKRLYEKQQQEIERLNAFISRFRYNASKARQVQSRVKQLEKIELIELPEHMQRIHFAFPPSPHSGKMVLELEGIDKAYGSNRVIQNLDLQLTRGEKLVVTGLNGAGKSTLLRIIAGIDQNYSGRIRYGSGVSLGYFSQEQTDLEENTSTLLEMFEEEAPTELVPKMRSLLGAFLFQGDDVFKQLKVLSGGEKSRVALLRLLLQPHNLLVLDEPTNHLDIHSKDILLDALKNFDGTLVFVSHDRYFIEHLAGRVLQLSEGGAKDFPGDYGYYLYRLEQDERIDGQNETRENHKSFDTLSSSGQDEGRTEYKNLKQQKNRLRKLEKEELSLIEKIENLDKLTEEIRREMARPEVYSDGRKITELQHVLNSKEEEHGVLAAQWEALLTEKEDLEKEVGE